MPAIQLPDRATITVSGPEAEHFLQTVLTTDLDRLTPGEACPGALLTPQGKILFDFLVSRQGADTLQLDCRADVAADFQRRLTMYKLRAKVEISAPSQRLVAVAWDDDSSASHSDSAEAEWLADRRFAAAAVRRAYGVSVPEGDLEAWNAFRVAQGVAESGADYALGDAFPHDVLLDQTGGVGFRKGCYVGQEVVSRMQHRGTARRRVLLVSANAALPPAGTDMTAAGKTLGTLGSVAGPRGLAIVRIDRVKAAMDAGQPILAGDVPVDLAIPPWASFAFPQDAADAEEA